MGAGRGDVNTAARPLGAGECPCAWGRRRRGGAGTEFSQTMRASLYGVFVMMAASSCLGAAPLVLPGATAYGVPEGGALRVDEVEGVVDWKDPGLAVVWYGQFARGGELRARLRVALPEGSRSRLRLRVGGAAREEEIVGQAEPQVVDLGSFAVKGAGYEALRLENLNPAGQGAGRLLSLELEGAAVEGAHFNVDPRRNAASVHLAYPVSKEALVSAFYNEVTAVEDPVHTYYMACGFSRGYFGMQVNSLTERRLIFSVWDSGSGQRAKDRSAVPEESHTRLLAKGAGVVAEVFGNEGTGGHSHFVYPWKTGQVQKFVVTAQPQGSATDYAGYWFHPEEGQWKLLARFRAPEDGKYLRGLYSFSENFAGETGHLRRKALFGNQWIRRASGEWSELLQATFSHDATGKAARRDRFMGVEGGQFFLSHGGFVEGYTAFGAPFARPGGGVAPDLMLPEAP